MENVEQQSFQVNNNPTLGLQGITVSLRRKGGSHNHNHYHSNISILCDHNFR